jgi:hypothetical protein
MPEGSTLLDVNFEEVPDFEAVPGGEYQIEVDGARFGEKEETGSSYALFRFEVIGPDQDVAQKADSVTEVFMIDPPRDSDNRQKQKLRNLAQLRDFAEMLDVPFGADGMDLNDFIGKRMWAILTDPQETDGYGAQNEISEFVKPIHG